MFNGLTNIGKEYIAKCLAENKPITFTKVKIGDGLLDLDENAELLTDVKSLKKEVEILDKTQEGELTTLTILLDNSDIEVGYYPREIGIYVTDDGVEKLYWYINDGVETQWLCAANKYPIKFKQIINLMTTNLESVIVNWSGKDLFVDREFVEEKIKEKVRTFEITTIAELQSRKNLKVGDIVEVLGYYTAGDGAGHKRIISDTDDGSGVQLNNKLWANIIHNGEVNSSWFGCKYNSLESARANYTNLLKAINYNQTVIINGDLYIEQNGDNIVTSENLILKGKDKAKLILCTNFENLNWFLINKNLKNLSFTDLEVKFNATTERVSVLFAIDGMIKVNNCDIEKCTFDININGRLMYWTNVNANIKPDLLVHGFDVFNFKNNVFNNILNSYIVIVDVIYKEFNIENNKINNLLNIFINSGITNSTNYEKELTDNKVLTSIKNNIVINNDNYILKEGNSYYCFVLVEGNLIKYENNHVEGLKADAPSDTAVYDLYAGGNILYYTNNVWKNNLNFNPNKTVAVLMKAKSVLERHHINNKFIITKEFMSKFNVPAEAQWIDIYDQTTLGTMLEIRDNYINMPTLRFLQSSQEIKSFIFDNNTIISENSLGNALIITGQELEKNNNDIYIFENNNITLGKFNNDFSFIVNYLNEKIENYNTISIKNNTINFKMKTEKRISFFNAVMNGDVCLIENNNFNQLYEEGYYGDVAPYSDGNRYFQGEIISLNNTFNNTSLLHTDSLLLPCINLEHNRRFVYNFKNKAKLQYISKAKIPKINDTSKFLINFKGLLSTGEIKENTLYFEFRSDGTERYFKCYNSLGNLEETKMEFHQDRNQRINAYTLNKNGQVTNLFAQLVNQNVPSEGTSILLFAKVLEYEKLEVTIDIM